MKRVEQLAASRRLNDALSLFGISSRAIGVVRHKHVQPFAAVGIERGKDCRMLVDA